MMAHQRPVVVGIDGSDSSRAAFAHGAWEAHRRGRPLRLVFAYPITVPYGLMGLVPDPQLLDEPPAQVRDLLAGLQTQANGTYPELGVQSVLAPGSPASVLVNESAAAELVVVGSRGLGGFTGLLLGSVGLQLAAHCLCPVVVIRPPEEKGDLAAGPAKRPVVVGVDGLPESNAALQFAADEASARGVELIALYAWWMLPPGRQDPLTPSHYDLAQAQEEARRLLGEATAGYRERYPDLPITLRPVHAANPIVALLDAAHDAGLLVVSRHGGNAVTRLLFSSIGDVAAREATCPVAVVPEAAP